MVSVAEQRAASIGDLFGFFSTFNVNVRIMYNILNIEYRIQETEGFAIYYLLFTIFSFHPRNRRNPRFMIISS